MPGNSIAISRELVAAGVEEKTASAVAEAIVTHSNDRNATKVEILELESSLKEEINALRNQLNTFEAETRAEFKALRAEIRAEAKKNDTRFNLLSGFMVANFAGVFMLVLQNLFGG